MGRCCEGDSHRSGPFHAWFARLISSICARIDEFVTGEPPEEEQKNISQQIMIEAEEFGDLVFLKGFTDDYRNLSSNTAEVFRWLCTEANFTHVAGAVRIELTLEIGSAGCFALMTMFGSM